MVGQNLSVFALYDSDSAGETAKGKFIKNWLTRYAGRKAVAFSFGEILGTEGKECSIEDIFPERFLHQAGTRGLFEAIGCRRR